MIALRRFQFQVKVMEISDILTGYFTDATKKGMLLFLAMLILVNTRTMAQGVFIDENIAYLYNMNNEVRAEYHVFQNGDSVIFHFELSFNNRFFDDFHYTFRLLDSYHTNDVLYKDTLDIQKHIISIKAGKVYIKVTAPRDPKADVAILSVIAKQSGIDYNFDVPLIPDYNFSNDGLIFFNADGTTPYLNSFINSQKEFMVRSIQPYDKPIYGFLYEFEFEEAVPPMIIEEKKGSAGFRADSVFTVKSGEVIQFEKNGLYFFQKDSSSSKGIGMRVQDKYFPLVKTFNEILPPLIYISTSAETSLIRNAENPQKAFDQFWIDNAQVPSVASAAVARYYERISSANYLFTSFKEGWKTDMGLIYIIFGPPNDAYKSEELIEWVYNQDMTMPNLRFSFYKVKNVFTDDHYTLMRKKTYDKVWFKSVELWRTGKNK
jgi:GWxTD domain-containing protein